MGNNVVAFNLFTHGGELKRVDGSRYIGSYYILEDGTIMSGRGPEQRNPPSQVLLPANYMPINENGDLVSGVNTDQTAFTGVYSVITIKNYNNDIDAAGPVLAEAEPAGPTITLQPDEFFRRDSALSYDPGREIFVDQNKTITVITGSIVPLNINFTSDDKPQNIKFEWIDSYDRVVADTKEFIVDTAEVDWVEETFYCVITDSYGSETSDEVTISIIDPFNHPIIFENILQNPYGNEDTAEWQSIGQAGEEVGKFLPKYEPSYATAGLKNGHGTIHYHKFSIVTSSISASNAGSVYKNQWYPRTEAIDFYNGFNITTDLNDNYFRAGQFFPVSDGQFDHAGTMKSSFQIVDLTEYENLLAGKVYGVAGFKAVMFGWLGGRADQGDRCYVEFEFYDENDDEIVINPDIYNNKIESLSVYDRIVNDARKEPDGTDHPTTVYQLGYNDTEFDFNYLGCYYDGNDMIQLNSLQAANTVINTNGLVQEIYSDALCKTLIVGRMSDMVGMPQTVRKIKVIKYYFHEPGKYDLITKAREFKNIGEDYTSDAMIAGLNLRLYPILIDASGSAYDTGIDETTGLPVIRGFNMDQLEPTPGPPYLEDINMRVDAIEWLNPNAYLGGLQTFTARKAIPQGQEGIDTTKPIINENGYANELPFQPLGVGYTITPNAHMYEIYRQILTPMSDTIHKALYQYVQKPYRFTLPAGGTVEKTIYDADGMGLLNYYDPGSTYGGSLWNDFDDDNVFR